MRRKPVRRAAASRPAAKPRAVAKSKSSAKGSQRPRRSTKGPASARKAAKATLARAARSAASRSRVEAAARQSAALSAVASASQSLNASAFGRDQLLRQRIDDLGQGYVSLAAELWIVKDRLAVLEEVLARHGIPAPQAVDSFEPDGEFKKLLDAQRREWTRRIIGALFPRGLPDAD